ncbi:major facilitator family transporter protein [Thauera sp. 27]|uniref:MFS transporter n=1 Tax=Thauera sp. 27 TaxID=305700 RepID=UPI0002CFF31C|nr:MFS transporter [Thauera sp. 27]ENO81780.1 major facilitator family transporter protein [Thauera sp. 27]
MLPTLVPIGALLSGIALLLLGSGLVNTAIPLRGSLEGFSANTLGLIGSTYFLGFFLGTFIAPRLIRRMGHIRAFAFFGATVASCILLHTLIVDARVWMGLRVLTGVGLVGFYAVIESWLNDQTAAERRGQVFAIYMVVNLAALAGAQQLLRLDTPAAFTLFAVAAIFVCLSLLPVTMTRLPQPQIGARPRLDLGLIWRAAPAAFVGALSSGLSMGAFWSLTPLYAEGIGLDAAGVGLLMSTAIIGGALLQWPMGRFSDAGDRRLALAVAAIGAASAGLVVALLGHLEHVSLAGLFVFGGAAFAVYPIVVAHLVDHLHKDEILAGNTGVLFLHGLGAAVGPAVAGALMGVFGSIALPLHLGLAFVPLAIYALLLYRRTRDEIVDEPAQFTAMMRTSPTVLEMVAPEERSATAENRNGDPGEGGADGAEQAPAADLPSATGAEDLTPSPAPTTDTAESRPAG